MNMDPLTRQRLVFVIKEAFAFLVISGAIVFCAFHAVMAI